MEDSDQTFRTFERGTAAKQVHLAWYGSSIASCAAMAGYEQRQAQARMKAGRKHDPVVTSPQGSTAEVLAAKAGVGEKIVRQAMKVRAQGTPELNARVAAGVITLNEAERIAKLGPAVQNRVAALDDKRARLLAPPSAPVQ